MKSKTYMQTPPENGARSERPLRNSASATVDWKAYRYLLRYATQARTPFSRHASEYGLTRLLDLPERQASGRRLARDLFRDGKRIEQHHNRRVTRELDAEIQDPTPFSSWETEVERSVGVVRQALQRVTRRQRRALVLNARGIFDVGIVREALGVGSRRYRGLVAEARTLLWSQPELRGAYQVLVDGIGGEHQALILELIEEVILEEDLG
jgi:hypothetical protein